MAEKLLDKIKEIWGKITEWWAKFTSKQRTAIVIIAVSVVAAFVILFAVISAPKYVILDTYSSTKETSQVTDILSEANILYKVSDDGLTVRIPRNNQSTARVALGAKGVSVSAYTIEEALSSSLTTTEADKQKKYKLYMESDLEIDIKNGFSNINSVVVKLTIPENDGTLLSKNEEPTAALIVNADDTFTAEHAANLAKFLATALHCSDTSGITIMDNKAKLLFTGEDNTSVAGSASTQLGVKKDAEAMVDAGVRKVLAGQGIFGDVKVAANLVIDFSSTEKTKHDYTPAEGQSQGVLSEESSYTSESSGGTGGVPGTDSNTETTYYYQNNDYSSSTIEELYRKYLPNEYIEHTTVPAGVVDYASSSMAVSSTNYVIVKEDDVKRQGLLDGITWEEYKAANSEKRQLTVTDEMLAQASTASGIPASKISIVAYEENFFVDSEGLGIDINNVLQIALIVIILALLAIVVLKSMKTEKAPEEAEELSVETLLQSNPEPAMDDIELEESSETKKLIEKFVDENPEAAANLLRNWLNEEWG